MNNFENQVPTPENPDENEQIIFETADSMHQIDALDAKANENLAKTTQYLDTQEPPLPQEKIGLLHSIGEKFKKSNLLKAAALGVTFISAQPAFAQNISNLTENPREANLNVDASDFNNIDQVQGNRVASLRGARLSTHEKQTKRRDVRIRLRDMSGLSMQTLQPNQLSINGRNILPGQINNFQQNTLPNATINGGPAYEIAPGIYGDKNTVYRQTPDGGTVLMGGINIE